MINNKLIMSKNVVYSNTENTLEADVVELNTISKIQKFSCTIQIIKLKYIIETKWL